MLGQCYSDKRFNLIILAGGLGTRMGKASDYIPKALVPLGEQRAIDWIIQRHSSICERLIVGTATHSDLIQSYVKGKYNFLNPYFSNEDQCKNPAISLMYCLDNADIRLPTIVSFCDLVLLDNFSLDSDAVYVANQDVIGNIGIFRHILFNNKIIGINTPRKPQDDEFGLLGYFVFMNTIKLKKIVYEIGHDAVDITDDYINKYFDETKNISFKIVKRLIEFGSEKDLAIARKEWENLQEKN